MSYMPIQKNRSAKPKRLGCGFLILLPLIFILVGSIPALLNLSGLQARFTGVKTTALATADGSCGSDDDDGESFTYLFTFTDSQGKLYRVNDGVCSSGIVSDGEHVTIWYQPDDPTHFITMNDLTFDLIFFAGFSLPLFLCIVFSLIWLLRQPFRRRRRVQGINL